MSVLKKCILYKSVLIVLAAFLLNSCNMVSTRMNKRVSLWRKDKIPYGTFVAYENLKYLFPDATINIYKTAPDLYDWEDTLTNLKTAYIILAPQVVPDVNETAVLLNMASAGCHIFISAFHVGEGFLDSLHAKMTSVSFSNRQDSLQIAVYNPLTLDSISFTYPGYSSGNYFTKIDTTITGIAGTNKKGKANFIQFRYNSGGTVSIQIEPFAFTNFFLLHKKNKAYYDNAFSYLPDSINTIEWDDYYRNKQAGRSNFSALSFLFKQPTFRIAIILILLVALLAVLAEAKRRQRIVPVIPSLQNSSLDFVKTIGRLYFQQRDHKNLAKKMIVHFLDHVRSRYNITTSVLDDTFVGKLSYKSGFDKQALNDIVITIKNIEHVSSLSEEQLVNFSKKLEQFYKNQS